MTDLLPLAALQNLWPHGDQHVPGLIEGIASAVPDVFGRYKIADSLTVAMIFGQFSEECGAGLEMVENDNFTASQLLGLWPSHFTGSMASRYAHNPRMICDVAYGGRMGNAPPPSDDGYNYRGRGLSQVTGKEGYQELQAELTKQGCPIDIMSDPDLISDPRYALLCGVADFVLCGCLPFAERGDILNTTKRLNGGTNGLASREEWTAKWKAALSAAPAPSVDHSTAALQRALNKLGADPPLVDDGTFGPATEHAVKIFQQTHGLTADGSPGPMTWDAITKVLAA